MMMTTTTMIGKRDGAGERGFLVRKVEAEGRR